MFNKWIIVLTLSILTINISCKKNTTASENTAPTASFTIAPISGTTTTTFTFDANSSSDNEDAMSELQVRWDWENDGVWDTGYSTAKVETHQYTTKGIYTVNLEVKDTDVLTNNSTNQVTVSDPPLTFNTCLIELEATGHLTATPGDPGPPYDFDRSYNGQLIKASGNFSDNTFTGTTEIHGGGGSIIETITAVLNDDRDMIISISGSWTSADDNLTSNEFISIIANEIPILPGSDSNLFNFQISGAETCDHITSMTDDAQSTNMGSNWTLNSLECNSDSNFNVWFQTE